MSIERTSETLFDDETPTEGNKRFIGQRPNAFHRTLISKLISMHGPAVGIAVGVGLVTLFVQGYRVNVAPDVYADEGHYIQVASNVARGAGFTEGHGIFFMHPPAYILTEAAYLKLAGLTYADLLTAVLAVRYVNAFFAAITASVLVLFGRKLHSYKVGLAAAVLFLMDPYIQSINRRGMLEPLAMLCVLLGMYLFFTHQPRLTTAQRCGSGVAFAVAILTKEAMVVELLALFIYVIWCKRSQLRDAIWVAVIACASYLPYVVWALISDQWRDFVAVKLAQASRIPLAIRDLLPGATPYENGSAQAHSLKNILYVFPQYGMSYLLIAVAAIFTAILILRFRYLEAARYLIAWSILSFAVLWVIAMVSQWYFYYLIVSGTVVCGYVLGLLLDATPYSLVYHQAPVTSWRWPIFAWASTTRGHRLLWAAILAVFLGMLLSNSYSWVQNYAVGYDNAYINAIKYVRLHIPKGETIVLSEEAGMDVFLPFYTVRRDRDPKDIIARHECYFLLASRGVGYGTTTPQFYSWVVGNSHPLFEETDWTFGKVGVYLRTATGVCQFTHGNSEANRSPPRAS